MNKLDVVFFIVAYCIGFFIFVKIKEFLRKFHSGKK